MYFRLFLSFYGFPHIFSFIAIAAACDLIHTAEHTETLENNGSYCRTITSVTNFEKSVRISWFESKDRENETNEQKKNDYSLG